MDKGQGQWEKLINLPEEYERNPDIVQRVIAEFQQKERQKQPKTSWLRRKWKPLVTCCASIAFVGICCAVPYYGGISQQPTLSISLSSSSEIDTPPQIVYYDTEELAHEAIVDLTTYLAEKSLNILHFSKADIINNQVSTIRANNELAFITQNTVHVGIGMDNVLLRCVIKKNAEFNFYDKYKTLDEVHSVGGINIKYQLVEQTPSGDNQVLAKFTYENFDYFLDITTTEQDGVQQLELYINMLLEG